MSKCGMPSCTAQMTVPPLSGCSAATTHVCVTKMSPETISNTMSPRYRKLVAYPRGSLAPVGLFIVDLLPSPGYCTALRHQPSGCRTLTSEGVRGGSVVCGLTFECACNYALATTIRLEEAIMVGL